MSDVDGLIKVAVRVRPFNKREKARDSKCIIQMKGKITTVVNPEDKDDFKSYTYDHSYWSFDGGKEDANGYLAPQNDKYADQQMVYDDMGASVLKNAWAGYNATLFAYGQTGSGKSWSVIGYGANKGIVPMLCEDLFRGIKEKESEGNTFEVRFSMLEIYNEDVHDLLNPKKGKGGLKVRQHPKKGFYAENLKSALVTSYQEIQDKMEEGTLNRTIASTNMNATSSRAHTIVGINFVQKYKNDAGQETAKQAVINLVDLAGSERVESTGATGKRLKEGAGINQSLSMLGNCISALAKQSQGESARVPYRDSTLTKLLMNALGGNSKTVMIAAISPADINYDETTSTLRYADRAKQIKTKATVNEDPTDKLLRELKAENERLKNAVSTGKVDTDFIDADGDGVDDRDAAKIKKKWEEEMKARMMENEKEMLEMKKSYEEKLANSKQDFTVDPKFKKIEEDKKTKPHMINLNMDPQLSGRIVHILMAGNNTIGNRKGEESKITMVGPGMQETHATISVLKTGKVNLKPYNTDCRILVNGSAIQGETTLCHNDRLVFGSTQIWVFQNPKEKEASKTVFPEITFDYAQEEIASKNGLDMGKGGGDLSLLQEDLLEVMPAVEEANSISEELDKRVKFEIMLVAPQMLGKTLGKPEIHVKMKNLENGTEFVWPKEKFLNRLYMMKEMYNNYEEEDEWDVSEEDDPFQESLDTEVHIGTVQVVLQPLAYNVELKEQLEITNYKASEVGLMNVEIVPCDATGREFTEADDMFVDTPDELLGKDIHFKFRIINCRGLPNRYADMYCSYEMYLDQDETATMKISDTSNPDFNHEKMYSFTPATKQLQKGNCAVHVRGKQQLKIKSVMRKPVCTATEINRSNRNVEVAINIVIHSCNSGTIVVNLREVSFIFYILYMGRLGDQMQQHVDGVRKLIKEAENISKTRVSTSMLKDIMNAPSPDQADMIIRRLADEPDNDFASNKESSVCILL
ncbi:unnamed protein product, partial [Meganyctiphanes norvegica]